MTLNQVIKRVSQIALAHKQVRNFYYGVPTDFLNDKTTRYASAFLQDTPGSLDVSLKTQSFGFKLYLLDLVHVSEDAKENEQDVQSDMLSVIKDLVAEMNHSNYSDWKISATNPVTLLREEFDDLVAGAVIDLTISVPYNLDTCVVPTGELPVEFNTDDMKLVYDIEYMATVPGAVLLVVPDVIGKKILLVTRENAVLQKVLSDPDAGEYTIADGDTIQLGAPIGISGERFLILYRNF
jgi:hypothetical protein